MKFKIGPYRVLAALLDLWGAVRSAFVQRVSIGKSRSIRDEYIEEIKGNLWAVIIGGNSKTDEIYEKSCLVLGINLILEELFGVGKCALLKAQYI